jgi:hypothetical protein
VSDLFTQLDLFPKGQEHLMLGQARAFLRERMNDGVDCPCCGRLVKSYKFTILGTMAATLMWIVAKAKQTKEPWVHLNNPEAPAWVKADRNYPRLSYWNLVVAREQEEKNEKRCSGYWKATQLGVEFVYNRTKVPKYVLAYNNIPYEESIETVSIQDVMKKKFNYEEMLQTWKL